MAKVSKISKEQELRWQAESVVRQAVENTPLFKKAVSQTIKQLKRTQKDAVNILKNKK